jgi:hypothetical protein
MRGPGGGFCALVVQLLFLLLLPGDVNGQYNFRRIALTGVTTEVISQPGGQQSFVNYSSLENPIVFGSGSIGFRGTIESAAGSLEGIWATRANGSVLRTVAAENEFSDFVGLFGTEGGGRVFGDLKMVQDRFITFRARLKGPLVTEDSDTVLSLWSESSYGGVFENGIREGSRTQSSPYVIIGDLFDTDDTVQETTYARFSLRDAPANADSAFSHSSSFFIMEGRTYRDVFLGDVSRARPVSFSMWNFAFLAPTRSGSPAIFFSEFGPFITLGPTNTDGIANLAFVDLSHPGTGSRLGDHHSNQGAYLILYTARLSGPGVVEANDSVVMQWGGTGTMIVREGTQVPGRTPGVLFGDLFTDNLVGGGLYQVLFNAPLTGTGISSSNDWSLVGWSPSANNLRVVAQEGQHVEGLPDGAVLTDLTGSNFQLNEFGRAIFNAPFDGPGGDGLGMFWADPDALPRTIVYTGQDFDIGGGMFRTISDIGLMELAGAMDGRGSQINSAGTIVFTLDFIDGSSGVFAVQVPEPAMMSLAMVAVVGLAVVRRSLRAARTGGRAGVS